MLGLITGRTQTTIAFGRVTLRTMIIIGGAIWLFSYSSFYTTEVAADCVILTACSTAASAGVTTARSGCTTQPIGNLVQRVVTPVLAECSSACRPQALTVLMRKQSLSQMRAFPVLG